MTPNRVRKIIKIDRKHKDDSQKVKRTNFFHQQIISRKRYKTERKVIKHKKHKKSQNKGQTHSEKLKKLVVTINSYIKISRKIHFFLSKYSSTENQMIRCEILRSFNCQFMVFVMVNSNPLCKVRIYAMITTKLSGRHFGKQQIIEDKE